MLDSDTDMIGLAVMVSVTVGFVLGMIASRHWLK